MKNPKIIASDNPVSIGDKYNSMDVFNAIVNEMKKQGLPGADKIPVVEDDEA